MTRAAGLALPARVRADLPGVVAALVLPSLWIAWRYGQALGSWWWNDDATILMHALRHPLLEYFYAPQAWRSLVVTSLTPWLSLVFALDHTVFGLDPAGYYAHNLAVLSGCAFLIYCISRTWVNAPHALGAALLFVVGSPVAVVSQQLMSRHYAEGLLLFLLALLVFVRAVQAPHAGRIALCTLLFAGSVTAKEIYLPLGLIVFFIPVGSWRARLACGWPLLVLMVLYVPWRRYMLGESIGGYMPTSFMASLGWRHYLGQYAAVASVLSESPLTSTALFVAGLAAAFWSDRRAAGPRLLVVGAALLAAPLLPLAAQSALGREGERFLFAVWAAITLSIGIALGLWSARGSRLRGLVSLAMLGALGLLAAQRSAGALADMAPARAEYTVQGRAILSAHSDDVLFLTPKVANWYAASVLDIRRAALPQQGTPRLAADEVELAASVGRSRSTYQYEPATGSMVDISAQVPPRLERWRSQLRDGPLSVAISYDPRSHLLRSRIGPHEQGEYRLIIAPGSTVILPADFQMRTGEPSRACFMVRHQSPDGGLVYSPLLSLTTGSDGVRQVVWSGSGRNPERSLSEPCSGGG